MSSAALALIDSFSRFLLHVPWVGAPMYGALQSMSRMGVRALFMLPPELDPSVVWVTLVVLGFMVLMVCMVIFLFARPDVRAPRNRNLRRDVLVLDKGTVQFQDYSR